MNIASGWLWVRCIFSVWMMFVIAISNASGQTDCNGCAPAFPTPLPLLQVPCGTPLDALPLPAITNPCGLQLSWGMAPGTAPANPGGLETCGATTAFGTGPDWAVWISGLSTLGLAPSNYFVTSGGPLSYTLDPATGDIHMEGWVYNDLDPSYVLFLDFDIQNRRTFAEWTALGRSWKDPFLTGNHVDWMYYELLPGTSSLTGASPATAGWHLPLFHNPSNFFYAFQWGEGGANNRNLNPGLGGWFAWSLELDGATYAGVGDVNVDLQNCTTGGGDIPGGGPDFSTCPNESFQWVTYTATSTCGSASATQPVYFVDNEPPTFVFCPPHATVPCGEPLPFAEPVALDGCGAVTLHWTSDTLVGTCPGQLTVHHAWTATDACGATAVCHQTLQHQVAEPPVLMEVPDDAEIPCEVYAGCAQFPLPYALDGCTGDSLDVTCEESLYNTELYPSIFDAVLVYTTTDACGQTVSDSTHLSVVDNQDPIIIYSPPNFTISLEQWGVFPIPEPICIDNCYMPVPGLGGGGGGGGGSEPLPCSVLMEIDPLCCGSFLATFYFSHTDNAGNTADTVLLVTVLDMTPPTWGTLPGDIVLACDDPAAQDLLLNPPFPSATDNSCPPELIDIAFEDEVLSECPGSSVITRTWSATDGCGNTTYHVQILTIEDLTAPVFTQVPADLTLECGTDFPPLTGYAAVDACSEVVWTLDTLYLPPAAGDCPAQLTSVVTYTASDGCGNAAVHTQQIHWEDTAAPVFVDFPEDQTVACGLGLEWVWPTATDACSDVLITLQEDTVPGLCPASFTLVRTFQAADACGNTVLQTQTIVQIDNQPPVFQTFADTVAVFPPDCSAEVDWVPLEAVDACSEWTLAHSATTVAGDCPGNWDWVVDYVAEDACGNVSTATQVILVRDTVAPVATGSVAILLGCGEPLPVGLIGATDGCGAIDEVVSRDTLSGPCASSFTVLETHMFTDLCGNSVSAAVEVSVLDTLAPMWAGPTDTLWLECGAGPESVPAGWIAFEDCDPGASWAWGDGAGEGTEVGLPSCAGGAGGDWAIQATDGCGNAVVWSMPVAWWDDSAPYLVAPLDTLFLGCGDSFPAPGVWAADACDPNPVITYNDIWVIEDCGGDVWHRTLTAVDACGNSLSAVQTLLIQDTLPPVFTDAETDTLFVSWDCSPYEVGPWPEALDACSEVSYFLEVDTVPGACSAAWTELYTYTAVDACGHATSVERVVEVRLEQAPVFALGEVWPDTLGCETDALGWLPSWEPWSCLGAGESGISWSDSVEAGDCPASFQLWRTLTLWDACGNTRDSVWVVAVVDTVAPVWESVPEDWTFDCGSQVPECGAFPATAEDLCSEVTWGCSDWASGDFSCSGLETIHRIHTATDACGNTAEHLQVISFQDTLPPVLSSVPADTTIDCREEAPDWSPGAFVPVVNCPSDEAITVTWLGDDWISGDCEDGIERSFRIEDGCGNATVHVQHIALIDSVPPVLVDPLPAPAYPCWESFLPCTDLFPLFFDACQTYSWTCQDVVLAGDCATNDCSVAQTFVVTDACGNAATFETAAVVGAYVDALPLLPTGFSPNQDGYNDTYRILGIGLDASEVACMWMEPNVFTAFNRWGNEVFQQVDYRNTWEGTSANGDALPNGTYFVVFEYRGQTFNTYVDLRR